MITNKKEQREEAQSVLNDAEQQITSLRKRFKHSRPKTNGGTLRNLLNTVEGLLNQLIELKTTRPSVYEFHPDIREQRFSAEISCRLFIADIETKIASS